MSDKITYSAQSTSLTKNERINSRKEISLLSSNKALISTGKIIILKTVRTKKIEESSPLIKIFISVPKKKIKRAVDRNKIKRQVREIFRNNKNIFPIQPDATLLVGFIYNTVEIYDFNSLKKEIICMCADRNKSEL